MLSLEGSLSFSASRLYLEAASKEPVSAVYVCMGSDLEICNEVALSAAIVVRSQPHSSAGDPGRHERHTESGGRRSH